PGSGRAGTKRTEEGRFYLGLVGLVALLVFGTLAVVSVLPIVIPGVTSAAITSGSMMPRLHTGDVVIAVSQGDAPISEGTIVVFEDPVKGDLVTHRIVGVDANGDYITKGDANGINDVTPVPPENVRGVGRWVVPYVGLLRVWLAEGQWLFLIIAIAATGVGVSAARCATRIDCDPWQDDEAVVEPELVSDSV
ncbi:MAG: signal peptidase I, partial [Actinomycetia bacterium]|nr:signal peptidase I [Actinomycetes bacterium]